MEKIYCLSVNGPQCKTKATPQWCGPSSAACQSWDLKSGRSITLAHEKLWNSPRGNVFTGRGCKWLFNKGIQKSAVNAGLQGVQNRRGRRREGVKREQHPPIIKLTIWGLFQCCTPPAYYISQVKYLNKHTYWNNQRGWFDCQKEPCWSCWERSGRQLSTFLH